MTHPLRRQAGEGGLDQGQVRGEEVPEEAGLHADPDQRRAQTRTPLERQEVPAAPQRHHGSQGPPEVQARAGQRLRRHPLLR